jgi:hypothetical protein
LSYKQLQALLLYIPLEKIKHILASHSDFLWVHTGIYALVEKIGIDENERTTAENTVKTEIAERGYTTLTSFDIHSTLELNPELSETAVRYALFRICLADSYVQRGNIITPKGQAFNASVVFADYCRSYTRLTLDELSEFTKEIGGNASQALSTAYDTMVRVNKDTFVGDSEIRFDVEVTDNAIALFMHSNVIPLQTVTSFSSFPYIDGFPWNWYLLESYCRRFSKRFGFQCLSVTSSNLGAIYLKYANFADYTDVLATAVACSNIELTDNAVGIFLLENNYFARRTDGVVTKVVQKARLIKERGI